MATKVEGAAEVRRPARGFMADQPFFTRFAILLTLFILLAFAQFAMRGLVDVRKAPPLVHLHGAVMVSWLGLFVAQNMLVHKGELALHRKLGWVAAALVAAVAVLGWAVGYQAVATGRVPPFFTPAYFLALTGLGATSFAAVVAWAVSKRRETQWHRRLMLGATILIVEPALGRLLPMPLLGVWGEWVVLLIQLGLIGIIARHDRKVLGQVHPATVALAAVALALHVAVTLVSMIPQVSTFAAAIAAR
jgi:uncharacterized membrane protein YozB (DUF420 family)